MPPSSAVALLTFAAAVGRVGSVDATERPYVVGEALEPGHSVETRPRRAAIAAGLAVFIASYSVTASIAIARSAMAPNGGGTTTAALFIPAIGPFIFAAAHERRQSESVGVGIFLGIEQVGGLIAIASGYLSARKVVVRGAPATAMVVPMFAESTLGLGALVVF